MISEKFPDGEALLCRDYPWGAPYDMMNKLGIFDPDAIDETNYESGRHRAKPMGRVRYPPRDELLNLHYRYLGIDYVMHRNAALLAKLGKDHSLLGPEWSYARESEKEAASLAEWQRAAVDISDPALQPWKNHVDCTRHSWWRNPPWWRVRWWHPRWWADVLHPAIKIPLMHIARLVGLMPARDHVEKPTIKGTITGIHPLQQSDPPSDHREL
jgi:hypothetical protein